MAPRVITPPEVWGVGQFTVGDERVNWELSADETMRDGASAAGHLRALGVQPSEGVLFTSMLSEAPHFYPLFMGSLMVGAQLSLADATPFDAYRTAMFLRTVDYRAVLGINTDVLNGLEDMGLELRDCFAKVPVLCARPAAAARLQDGGLVANRFLLLGPALAIEASPGEGLRVDPELWDVGVDDGELVVTNLTPRRQRFERQRTGVRGSVRIDGELQLVEL